MDILDALRQVGIEVRQNSADRDEYVMNCLFCVERGETEDTKMRLGFNVRLNKGHCFNCNWSSRDVARVLAQKIQYGGALTGVPLQRTDETRRRPKKLSWPEGYEPLAGVDETDELLWPAKQYLLKRGVPLWQIRRKQVGATVLGDMAYRIIIPVFQGGKMVGQVGRDWTGAQKPKYKNTTGTKVIYGLRDQKKYGDRVILSEGVVKAWAIERALLWDSSLAGIQSAALLGNTMTAMQLNTLLGFREIILFPDPQTGGGWSEWLVLGLNLMVDLRVTIVQPWPRRQADEMQRGEILQVIRQRTLFTRQLAQRAKQEVAFAS